MNWIEALILGIVQGLTEFLPVSSSGHLEIGKALLGVDAVESLNFTIAVHGATVLSTIVVFRKDIAQILGQFFKFKWNDETKYIAKILLSMVPVGIVGVFLKDQLKSLFGEGNVVFVGIMLLVTATLLAFTYFAKSRKGKIGFSDAFIIGIAQAMAVLPGISRSGSTIATGLLLGKNKEAVTRFSFLMVLIPILGENLLDIISGDMVAGNQVGAVSIIVGFIAAFLAGLLACSWMIKIVKKGKLIYFAAYCMIVGLIAILVG
jgi:undecaprenyl-diphosphatase